MKTKLLLYFVLLGISLINLQGTNQNEQGQKNRSSGNNIWVKSSKLSQCKINLPANYDREKVYPLVVALHGNGGSKESFSEIWKGFSNPKFILAVPEGPYIFSNAFRSGRRMFSWYLPSNDKKIWKMADPLSEEFVINVLDAIFKKHKIGRVFIMGFSQGAALAYAVGIKNYSRITGIVCVGGAFPKMSITDSEVNKASALNVLIATGRKDPHMGIKKLKLQKDFLKSRGYQPTGFIYEGAHQVTRELLRKMQRWLGSID